MIGEVLGNRYELMEKIGEGGMSVVYKARDNKLSRLVAVKILKKEFCNNEDIVKKFKVEATAIATLSDSNIVNVLDVGTEKDDVNYIVMEYVKGKTLKDVIVEAGSLNYETTLAVGIQIARALECAHKNGIIHRDVKPQNILVSEDGLVKVTDFGIAKSVDSTTMTNTKVMGSAHYFSPEQAKGEVVDTRTDLYSFGIVLYEMVTGRLPFEADSPVTIALKHIQEPVVPPKKVNSKVPESLNNLIVKLMSKNPNDRYQSAKEILLDLQKIKDDPNVIIGGTKTGNEDLDDGHTIVMGAVNPRNLKNNTNNDYDDADNEDDEYDDDYDDDYYDDDYDDDDKKSSKRKKIVIGIICGIVGLILVFVVAFLAFGGSSKDSSSDLVAVPSVVGMSQSEAKAAIEKAGLVYVDAGTEKSDKKKGTVVEVDPKESKKVEKGSKVRVITSSGKSETVKMPDFADSSLDTVKKFLSKNNITNVTYEEKYSSTIAQGCVISTDPEAGTKLDSDTDVTVYVSKGPETVYVTVPDVTGWSYNDAKAKLEGMGLKVSKTTTTVTSESQNNMVQSQTNSGDSVESGSTITLTVGVYTEQTNNDNNNNNSGNKSNPSNSTGNYISVGSVVSKGMRLEDAHDAINAAAEAQGITVHIVDQGIDDENKESAGLVQWDKDKAYNGDTITLSFQG